MYRRRAAALDNNPALQLYRFRGEQGAGQEKIHAQGKGSPAVKV
jgi:hypothetical protein